MSLDRSDLKNGRARLATVAHHPHRKFLGVPFGTLDICQAVGAVVEQSGGAYSYVVTPNVAHVVNVHEDPDRLFPVYRGAWLSLCDSQIVRGLAALRGIELPLVPGSDLVATLMKQQNSVAAPARRRILIVGPDAAAEKVLRERYPNAIIEVMSAPAKLAQRGDLRQQVARDCTGRPWDILLLCVGSPAQELIAALIAVEGRNSGVALCVGASIDFLTGRRSRAPRLLQRFGLEWAYRLASEPRRLWHRYLVEGPRIFGIYFANYRARPVEQWHDRRRWPRGAALQT